MVPRTTSPFAAVTRRSWCRCCFVADWSGAPPLFSKTSKWARGPKFRCRLQNQTCSLPQSLSSKLKLNATQKNQGNKNRHRNRRRNTVNCVILLSLIIYYIGLELMVNLITYNWLSFLIYSLSGLVLIGLYDSNNNWLLHQFYLGQMFFVRMWLWLVNCYSLEYEQLIGFGIC